MIDIIRNLKILKDKNFERSFTTGRHYR